MKRKVKKKRAMRMDFLTEIVSVKERESGGAEVVMRSIPDPKRYETIQYKDGIAYKDKATGVVIPGSVVEEMTMVPGAPVYYSPPKEQDFCEYIQQRRSGLLEHWDEEYSLPDTRGPIEELLNDLRGKDTQVVILYVDMEGSTRISSEVDSDTNLKIIKIFSMEMAKVIDNFRGYVLKFVGDCVIGIFPADVNFTSMCDNAIQASMIICSIIEDVINPIFSEKSFPEIGCHVGLDIGSVRVDKVGAIDVASIDDLIGYPMNLTAKIQSMAGHNDVLLGRSLYELLHTSWQQYCKLVDLGETWTMKDHDGKNTYEVYRFTGRWFCTQNHV